MASPAKKPKLENEPLPAITPAGAPPLSTPSLSLTAKHFIVTGGTQGLGLEIAKQLKVLGASKLALLSRSQEKGQAVVQELTGEDCSVTYVKADMSDAESVLSSAAEAIKALDNKVDGLINAAGITERGNLLETTIDGFNRQFDTNTRAVFFMTQAVAKHMIAEKIRGAVVNISSVAAKGGAPFISAYSASKAAVNCLTLNNATELAPHGIRVNAVNMGWTYTENENKLMLEKTGGKEWLSEVEPSLPLQRIMYPVDVACTVCFLLSPAAQMTTGHIYDLHPDTQIGMLSSKTVDSLSR